MEETSPPLLSIVIPSYNRRDCMLALLKDLSRQKGVSFEIIIVDDCSSDDTVGAVTKAYPQVRMLVNAENSGPAVSRNRGIMASRGKYVVGFDSDVTLPDDTLLQRTAAILDQSAPATGLAFRILRSDGKSDDIERWWHPLPAQTYAGQVFETSYFSGTAYAFPRRELAASGMFPEIFFMHYEEVELAFRFIDNGGTILHRPDLCVHHHANATSRRSEVKVFYKPRNQILLTARCYPAFRGLKYLMPRLIKGAVVALGSRHFSDWIRALRSARHLLPKCFRERKTISHSTWTRIHSYRSHQPLVTSAHVG